MPAPLLRLPAALLLHASVSAGPPPEGASNQDALSSLKDIGTWVGTTPSSRVRSPERWSLSTHELPHPTRALTHSPAYRLASIFLTARWAGLLGVRPRPAPAVQISLASSTNSVTLRPCPDDRGVPSLDERLSLFPLAGEEALERLLGTDRDSEDFEKDYAENVVFVSLFQPLVLAQISGLRLGSATDHLAIGGNPDVLRRYRVFDVVSWVWALSLSDLPAQRRNHG